MPWISRRFRCRSGSPTGCSGRLGGFLSPHHDADIATSMLGDRLTGRALEWDIRNGVILRKARKHGLPAPVSEIIVPLLAAASDGPG